jgi:protein phosphatase
MSSDPKADTGLHQPLSRIGVIPPQDSTEQVEVEFGALTHPGLVRENNEDCFLVGHTSRRLETVASNIPPGSMPFGFGERTYGILVADGLGGHSAGEVASRIAISTVINLILHTPDWIMLPVKQMPEAILQRMSERFQQAGLIIQSMANRDPELGGMGTTLTVVASLGDELLICHIGDSRAYVFRHGSLIRLTRDHTYSQELADQGLIRQEEVDTHMRRYVLTRYLGGKSESSRRVDIARFGLEDRDRVLVCSDGLTEMVKESEIEEILAAGRPAQETCQTLIDAALGHGGKDNVTVALADYRIPSTGE